MTGIIFTVVEKATGWFVTGADPIGPFFSKERAMDLAEGMVAALRASGEAADFVVETRSWNPRS
jgi:hypothetical protein